MADVDPVVATLLAAAVGAIAAVAGSVILGDLQRRAQREQWAHDAEARRLTRSEDAALATLETVDKAARLFGTWNRPEPEQRDIEPHYLDIRRLSVDIADQDVREALRQIADLLYYAPVADTIRWEPGARVVAYHASEAARRIVGAYRRGEPIPDDGRLRELAALLQEQMSQWEEEYEEEEAGLGRPAKPTPRDSTDAASG